MPIQSEAYFINELIGISRFYGGNPEYTLAGGGNTSYKNNETLFVKASGASLSDARGDSFVKMDRSALNAIWDKTYPASGDEREKEVLADLMASRAEGEGQKRPSVEALLHDIIPFAYVVHLHPALVNGVCCSNDGEKAANEIFESRGLWIPSINPGYILSRYVKQELSAYHKKHKKYPGIILLQNHGIFAGDNTCEGVKNIYNEITAKIAARVKRKPDFSRETRINFTLDASEEKSGACLESSRSRGVISGILQTLKELAGYSSFTRSCEVMAFLKNKKAFYPVSSAFTPDHIVYAGSDPLFVEDASSEAIREGWENHTQKTGRKPKIAAVKNTGVFSAAAAEKAAGFALDLFKDSVKIAVYSESFGGPLFMEDDKINFINNWEVERYRSSVSAN